MVSYKKFVYALSIMFTLLNGQFIKSIELGESEARKYINDLLNNLFIPTNHSEHQQYLHKFAQEVTETLTNKLGKYPHFYSFSKVYSDTILYQEVIGESLIFIEKCARNCAISEIQQYYSETTTSQKIFVDKIVNIIMKEVKNKITKSSMLSQGAFTNYFGATLTTRVLELINKELKKEAARIEKLNAKIKCPTCSRSYNTDINKKLTLGCAHTICLSCLKELWNQAGPASACAKCNTQINMSEYIEEAKVTSQTEYNNSIQPIENSEPVIVVPAIDENVIQTIENTTSIAPENLEQIAPENNQIIAQDNNVMPTPEIPEAQIN